MNRTLQIPSRFLPCPSRVLGIWLVLGLFKSGPDPSDTIVIPAMSHQNAWYLNGPRAVHGRPGVSRYHRDSHRVPSDCLISGWSCGFGGAARPSRYHRDCCRVPSECLASGRSNRTRQRGRRPREEGREEGREREEGIPQKGVLAAILIVWQVPGSHFACLGSWG